MIIPRLPSVVAIRRGAIAALLLVAAACSEPLTRGEQLTVERYLLCYECPAPLAAVRLLGDAKPEATVDSLNAALRSGPSAPRLAETRSQLHVSYAEDSAWAKYKPIPIAPRDSTVNLALARYVNGYRARGALGMGWIRTPAALQYLDDAIATGGLPASVLAAARYARDSLPQPNAPRTP